MDDTIRGAGELRVTGANIPVRFELTTTKTPGSLKPSVDGFLSGEALAIRGAVAARTGVLETESGIRISVDLRGGGGPGLAKLVMRPKG